MRRKKRIKLKRKESKGSLKELAALNLSLNSIKRAIEFIYNVDISKNTREAYVIRARRMYYYIARITGYAFQDIADVINQEHSNAIYHFNKMRDEVKIGDKQTCKAIDGIFKTKLYLSAQEREIIKYNTNQLKLSQTVLKMFKTVPMEEQENIIAKIEAMAQSYKFKYADRVKEYVGEESAESLCF